MVRDELERARRRTAGGPVDLDAARSALAAYASARPEIEAIWLFGSQARNEPRRGSDLDLALQINPRVPREEEVFYTAARAREIEALLGTPVDVVLLSRDLPLPLAWEIIQSPRILFERKTGLTESFGSHLRGLCRDQWPRLER